METAEATDTENLRSIVSEEQRGTPFWRLVQLLQESDSAAISEIDPEKLVGDIADKIDALDYVIKELTGKEAMFLAAAKEYMEAAKAIANNKARLKDYVAEVMKNGDLKRLDGQRVYANRISFDSFAMVEGRQATAEDYIKLGKRFVEQVTSYRFKADECKEAYQANSLPDGIVKKNLVNYVRFYPNTGKPKPKAKKKGEVKA